MITDVIYMQYNTKGRLPLISPAEAKALVTTQRHESISNNAGFGCQNTVSTKANGAPLSLVAAFGYRVIEIMKKMKMNSRKSVNSKEVKQPTSTQPITRQYTPRDVVCEMFDDLVWISGDQAIGHEHDGNGVMISWLITHQDALIMECLNGVFGDNAEPGRISAISLQRLADHDNKKGLRPKLNPTIAEGVSNSELGRRGYEIARSVQFTAGGGQWAMHELVNGGIICSSCYLESIYRKTGVMLPHSFDYYASTVAARVKPHWDGSDDDDFPF